MTARRSFIAGAASGLLVACGGGAVSNVPAAAPVPACPRLPALVSCWGDSITSGSIAPSPDVAGGTYLAVRPVERLQQMLAAQAWCIDRGVPALSVEDLWPGWESSVRMDPAAVLVLRVGGADTLGGVSVQRFEGLLHELVLTCQRAGKRVVLPGVIHMARKPEWQDRIGLTAEVYAAKADKAAQMDRAVQAVALATGAVHVDVRALPFAGPADIADAVHPAQAYADRCVAAIAAAVRGVL